jgi:hypothetical protein
MTDYKPSAATLEPFHKDISSGDLITTKASIMKYQIRLTLLLASTVLLSASCAKYEQYKKEAKQDEQQYILCIETHHQTVPKLGVEGVIRFAAKDRPFATRQSCEAAATTLLETEMGDPLDIHNIGYQTIMNYFYWLFIEPSLEKEFPIETYTIGTYEGFEKELEKGRFSKSERKRRWAEHSLRHGKTWMYARAMGRPICKAANTFR